eukprot:XP_011660477.1 PREDICTED: uncharacterized protein LOC105436546 [Strongylocentrotus purpuratus]
MAVHRDGTTTSPDATGTLMVQRRGRRGRMLRRPARTSGAISTSQATMRRAPSCMKPLESANHSVRSPRGSGSDVTTRKSRGGTTATWIMDIGIGLQMNQTTLGRRIALQSMPVVLTSLFGMTRVVWNCTMLSVNVRKIYGSRGTFMFNFFWPE